MCRQFVAFVIATLAGSGAASAHHTEPGRVHLMSTVRIAQPVLAGGQPLAPGTYEVIVTDERPGLNTANPDAQRTVEFVQNGNVVAREVAEVFPASEREAVGTSGTADDAGSAARRPSARVQLLKGGEFLRVAISDSAARYLIHLPTGAAPIQR